MKPGQHGSNRLSLFEELKRRNVFRVCIAYLALAWLVMQVADVVLNHITAPGWVFQVLLLFLTLGLPFAVFFAWAFEVTPQGIQRDRGGNSVEPGTRHDVRKLDIVIVVFLALALGYFLYDRFAADGSTAPPRAGEPVAQTQPAHSASPGRAPVAVPEIETPLLDDRPAIAVLPFENLSPDPDQAFFADGLAEDLITRLSSWRAFPVIAHNSSFRYRGRNVDLKAVSEALGARYIVEGSVRRAGNRIRVAAQLIDAASGEHVWADTYDGVVDDVFTLQDEFSAAIAAPLVDDLNRAEAERARRIGTENLEAWSLYQLGLQHADRFTRDDFNEAGKLFTRAIQRDPRFATALAELALARLWQVALGWDETPGDTVAAALESARRATTFDARDPAAQAALGFAYLMSGDLENGLAAAGRAVQLNPSSPEAWGWLSWARLLANDTKGCIDAAKRTQRLAPLSVYSSIVNDNLSQAYWQEGRYVRGLEAARRLLAERPDYFLGHIYVAMNAVGLGKLDEARAAINAARRAQPDLSLAMVQGMYGVTRPAIDARRNAVLRSAGLE